MAALGTLSAGLAHEINNPLTCVLLNLHFVVRRLRAASASDETFTELAGGAREGLAGLVQALLHAVEGANRIRQVVGDVSTFAQGNVERRELVDVRGILESSMQLAWQEIRHRAHLSRTLAKVPPVEANEARLGQLFLCLLVNAAHAIPEGQADRHEVRVMTKTDAGNNAVVEISDTGRGIAPENLSRVFDPFFTTERQNGSGLGLAISYGTVKSLGGEIAVTSEPGRGTTFRVILRPAELSPAGMPPRRNGGPATLRRRVLVIDDDRLVGEAIARAVSETHDVEIVTETCHALDRITGSERHNVIVCELMMPVMTGMDLYAKILPRDPTLAGRFVFTTTGAFSARARAFLESVSNACLPKPLDMGRLRSIVARANRLSAFEGSLPPG
jgi:nitrogen-specific signal transduction histidine kinase